MKMNSFLECKKGRHCEERNTCEASLNTIENNKSRMKNLSCCHSERSEDHEAATK